ncbi:MAG TPA: hypothetical protein PK095_01020 [Myxococcota bacterium]|nr:hypothetical protein [Myxococcota bacterium]
MKPTLFALAALAALSPLAACGDDTTIVELTVIETIPVAFDTMEGGVAEVATVDLVDLRDEPRYADVVSQLRCGALDATASFLRVEALDVGAGATVVDYQVEVATRGTSTFVPLLRFNGSITEGDRIDLTNDKVTLDTAGLQRIAQTILSTTPSLSVRITGTVPAALDDLQIAVSLALFFSSEQSGCPSTTTGL